MIKCWAMTQVKALLYVNILLTSDNKHAVCGTDVSPIQINFFAKNISEDCSLWRRLSVTC